MKTLKLYAVCVALLTSSVISAEGSCENRSTSSGGGWRLRAKAKVKHTIFPSSDNAQTANPNFSIEAYASKGCGWQRSKNEAGAHTLTGNTTGKSCSRGYGHSELFNQLVNLSASKSEDEVLEQCEIGMDGSSISGNVITITNIHGFMEAMEDMYTLYSIKVWLPTDEDDTLMTAEELLYNGTIKIINGEVTLEGNFIDDFGSAFFVDSIIGAFKRVRFLGSDLSITINLPEGRSMEELVIITGVDGAANEDYSTKEIVQLTENEITGGRVKLSAYPNPFVNGLTVNYKGQQDAKTRISLYNELGQLIATIFNGQVLKDEEVSVKYDQVLQAGKYYLLVTDGHKQYVVELIKGN